MTPVHCTVKHDPPNSYGDCVRACIASILDLPAEAVDHFYHDDCSGEVASDRIRKWLGFRGLAPFVAHYDGSIFREEILGAMEIVNPNVLYMLYGRTDAGDHVVICRGAEVVHDPAWITSALIGPGSNGFWSIMVVARA